MDSWEPPDQHRFFLQKLHEGFPLPGLPVDQENPPAAKITAIFETTDPLIAITGGCDVTRNIIRVVGPAEFRNKARRVQNLGGQDQCFENPGMSET